MDTSKGGGNYNERALNEDGTERVVETVDFQSPAGHGQEVRKKGVEVVHQCHPSGEDDAASGGGRGIVGRAGDAVTHAAQAAKDAVSGHGKKC